MQWDLFCRVVDNLGDIGVCWRLAADLAQRGEQVRLWADDRSALAWMAPAGAPGVSIHDWTEAAPSWQGADVVVEAFGCELPGEVVRRMATLPRSPAWINLEYLSAEAYAERCHALPSPQLSGPGQGLVKHFFYPGFTTRTGGLLREPGLPQAMADFDATRWLGAQGISARAGERRVSLFCYDNAPVAALLRALADQPTLLLVTPGPAAQQVSAALQAMARPPSLRVHSLPWLPQVEFDRLLWACDLNFVRGEDSLLRALWAGQPMVWQIYRQHDGAHWAKLNAFLELQWVDAKPALRDSVRRLWVAWNSTGGTTTPDVALEWPDMAAWRAQCAAWRGGLCAQADLVTQLTKFVAERR